MTETNMCAELPCKLVHYVRDNHVPSSHCKPMLHTSIMFHLTIIADVVRSQTQADMNSFLMETGLEQNVRSCKHDLEKYVYHLRSEKPTVQRSIISTLHIADHMLMKCEPILGNDYFFMLNMIIYYIKSLFLYLSI